MTRTTRTEEEEVENLHRRASELKQKISVNLVIQAVRIHPSCAVDLISKLEAIGIVTTVDKKKKVKPSTSDEAILSFQAKAHVRRKRTFAHVAPADGDDDVHVNDGITTEDVIPSKYWTLGTISPLSQGSQLLTPAEPALLTKENLSRINVRGKKLQNIEHHNRLAEFMSGMPMDFKLVGIYRSWEVLRRRFLDNAAARCRVTSRTTLPIDYNKPGSGLYDIAKGTKIDEVIVTHNLTGEDKIFPRSHLPYHRTIKELYIANNWSELRACLSSTVDANDGKDDVVLLPSFTKQCVKEIRSLPQGVHAILDVVVGESPPQVHTVPKRTQKKTEVISDESKKKSAATFFNTLAKNSKEKKQRGAIKKSGKA
jgi:hypothetical protein